MRANAFTKELVPECKQKMLADAAKEWGSMLIASRCNFNVLSRNHESTPQTPNHVEERAVWKGCEAWATLSCLCESLNRRGICQKGMNRNHWLAFRPVLGATCFRARKSQKSFQTLSPEPRTLHTCRRPPVFGATCFKARKPGGLPSQHDPFDSIWGSAQHSFDSGLELADLRGMCKVCGLTVMNTQVREKTNDAPQTMTDAP